MDDSFSIIVGAALIAYMFWFILLISKFRLRNIKRKALLRSELRRIRVLIIIASLILPTITSGLLWAVALILKQELPSSSLTLLFLMVCPIGLWLSSTVVLWSYTTGWPIVDSKEYE